MNTYITKRLTEKNRGKCLEHFLRLDQESIYTRFCAPLKEEAISNYVNKMNFDRDGIFGVFDEHLNIVGLGECVIMEESDRAEVGFSVEVPHRGKHLGDNLMKRIVRFAKAQNKHHLEMVCLRTNTASIHIAKKHGLHIQESYGGESLAVIDMNNIVPAVEVLNESVDDTLAFYALQQRENINKWEDGQKAINQVVGNTFENMVKMLTPKFF